ncbi:MAG TPA: CAP domain-containing protein [Candidatus Sulfotelmatobacter sp.]|jgi:uncharacterized protein YkwD|nr:CAP domain-containing protein [Candidatus Sulfotelmatobacter sp.]
MLQKKIFASQYHIIYPLLLIVFLTIGIFTTVNQSQTNQELNSHAANTTTNCTISTNQLTIKAQEQTLFGLINQYRVQNNLNHLVWNNTLKQSAEWQSLDMLMHNKLSHTDSLGRTPDIRLINCGYDISNGYGETIANGTTNPNIVFLAWKNDPPHNQILLSKNYNIAGVALETNSARNVFWTVDFGVSSTAPTPTTIADNPTLTPSETVTLNPTDSNTTPIISSGPTVSQNPDQPTPTPAPITADMLITIQVKIFGIGQGGNPNPLHRTRHITAYVYDTGTSPVTTGNAYLAYDGNNYFTGVIHLGKLAQGSYFIKLAGDNTLQVLAKPEFQTLLIGQVNLVPPVTLYQGDMNGDNVLDIEDYNLVLPCFQSIPTCANASAIDFNDDGKTDVTDYNLLLQSFEVLHGN